MSDTKKNVHYTLLIDLDKCTGCQACSVACKMENNVDLGVFWNRVKRMGPVGQFPDNLEMFYFPNQCMHCEEPTCIEVCPTKATYKTDTGVVLVDADRCFGCQYCIWACPYDARTLNPNTKTVEKCIMCVHLLEKGEKPMCVYTCTTQCRYAGDINDPDSEISQYLAKHKDRQFKIHPEFKNNPSVIYLMPRKGAETLCKSIARS
ncbi:MAG: 4Fe-4S dicluster domain-containing protein [Firmicutes bacterium]|nr:4Fe-4S dicluster domain-containing protein [Clostridiales bacterium]MBQ9932143.1 4Fe-4S dicluster domain-containing protein [Bacillota bacterium]